MISTADSILVFINEFGDLIMGISEGLNYDIFGDHLLSFMLQLLYSLSVMSVFALPFIVIWWIMKRIIG